MGAVGSARLPGRRAVIPTSSTMPARPTPARAVSWLIVAITGLLAFAAFFNAAAYIAYAGNPLVASDAWYFVDAFLQRALDGGAGIADFFVKREVTDHAQPLVKALLLINAKWLGLDFVFEAMMGLGFALATFAILVVGTWGDAREAQPSWLHGLGIASLAAVLVTLNSGIVFSWSLVTLGYACYAFAALGGVLAWRALVHRRYAGLLVVSLLIAFQFDDVGLLISTALIVSLVFAAAKIRRWRSALIAILLIAMSELVYQAISHAYLQPAALSSDSGGILGAVQQVWAVRTGVVDIARIVFGSTLAHSHTLTYYFPGQEVVVQSWLAAIALLAHAWFWLRAWRGTWNCPAFLAVALMLLFYAMVAGIIFVRVPEFGVNYLHDPRYVAMYLLSNVSLVLMVLAQPLRKANAIVRMPAAISMVLLIALQVPLAQFTWHQARYLATYYHQMAYEMLVMGDGGTPPSCVPILSVCQMPLEERIAAIAFLKQHHLNVYSSEFVARYRLQKLVKEAPEPAR